MILSQCKGRWCGHHGADTAVKVQVQRMVHVPKKTQENNDYLVLDDYSLYWLLSFSLKPNIIINSNFPSPTTENPTNFPSHRCRPTTNRCPHSQRVQARAKYEQLLRRQPRPSLIADCLHHVRQRVSTSPLPRAPLEHRQPTPPQPNNVHLRALAPTSTSDLLALSPAAVSQVLPLDVESLTTFTALFPCHADDKDNPECHHRSNQKSDWVWIQLGFWNLSGPTR